MTEFTTVYEQNDPAPDWKSATDFALRQLPVLLGSIERGAVLLIATYHPQIGRLVFSTNTDSAGIKVLSAVLAQSASAEQAEAELGVIVQDHAGDGNGDMGEANEP